MKLRFWFLISCLFFSSIANSQKEIALTIDDLPFVGEAKNFHLNMIIDTLNDNSVPATGFIIAKEVRVEYLDVLQRFRDSGLGLGNHTWSHANLNRLSADQFIQEIEAADKTLAPFLTYPKYFRYPYLAEGAHEKKDNVRQYLAFKEYEIAPVTIDSKDFMFNQLLLSVPEPKRRHYLKILKQSYLEFIWQQTLLAEEQLKLQHKPNHPQILLIHANLLNAYTLPDIIQLYKNHGYQFVTLEQALHPHPIAKKNQFFRHFFQQQPQDDIANDVAWD